MSIKLDADASAALKRYQDALDSTREAHRHAEAMGEDVKRAKRAADDAWETYQRWTLGLKSTRKDLDAHLLRRATGAPIPGETFIDEAVASFVGPLDDVATPDAHGNYGTPEPSPPGGYVSATGPYRRATAVAGAPELDDELREANDAAYAREISDLADDDIKLVAERGSE